LYSGSAPEGAHSIDLEPELPRLPISTLYGRLLRDRSWGDKTSRIVQASQETLDGETLDAVRDVPRSCHRQSDPKDDSTRQARRLSRVFAHHTAQKLDCGECRA